MNLAKKHSLHQLLRISLQGREKSKIHKYFIGNRKDKVSSVL